MGSGSSSCKVGWAQKAWDLPAAFLTRGRVGWIWSSALQEIPRAKQEGGKDVPGEPGKPRGRCFCFLVFSTCSASCWDHPPSPCRSGSGSWDRPADAPEELLRQSEPSPSRGDTRWDPAQGLGLAPSASSWAGNEQLVRSRAGIRIQTGQQSNRKWKILRG